MEDSMKYRTLGRDLTVSAISLGCMGMTHAFGAPSDTKEMTRLIHEAVELGYTMFDTAECYTGDLPDGSTAYNEELVGAALKPYRDKVVISTKCGVQHAPDGLITDSRPETIRKSVEGSLKRLGTDTIDLYYQHRIDSDVEPETVAETMAELIKEGKIRYWGISEANEEYLRRAHAVCPVTAVQNRYSMMARRHEPLFHTLLELNIGYVAFSPLANGLLSAKYDRNFTFASDDYRSRMPQFSAEGMAQNQVLIDLLEKTAEEKKAAPAQISLAWMLCKHNNLVAIPGTRKSDRLRENAGAADIELAPEELARIDCALNHIEMSAVFGGAAIVQ